MAPRNPEQEFLFRFVQHDETSTKWKMNLRFKMCGFFYSDWRTPAGSLGLVRKRWKIKLEGSAGPRLAGPFPHPAPKWPELLERLPGDAQKQAKTNSPLCYENGGVWERVCVRESESDKVLIWSKSEYPPFTRGSFILLDLDAPLRVDA